MPQNLVRPTRFLIARARFWRARITVDILRVPDEDFHDRHVVQYQTFKNATVREEEMETEMSFMVHLAVKVKVEKMTMLSCVRVGCALPAHSI